MRAAGCGSVGNIRHIPGRGGDAGWVTPGDGSGRRRRHMTTTADGWTPQAPAAVGRTTIFF